MTSQYPTTEEKGFFMDIQVQMMDNISFALSLPWFHSNLRPVFCSSCACSFLKDFQEAASPVPLGAHIRPEPAHCFSTLLPLSSRQVQQALFSVWEIKQNTAMTIHCHFCNALQSKGVWGTIAAKRHLCSPGWYLKVTSSPNTQLKFTPFNLHSHLRSLSSSLIPVRCLDILNYLSAWHSK